MHICIYNIIYAYIYIILLHLWPFEIPLRASLNQLVSIYWARLCVMMEGNKSRESRKGNNRRRGGRKEEKRELRRMNSKSEETVSWPQISVADIENTVDIVEQETSLDLENFDNGKSRMLCSFFSLSALIRVCAFYSHEISVKARHFEVAFINEKIFRDKPNVFYVN